MSSKNLVGNPMFGPQRIACQSKGEAGLAAQSDIFDRPTPNGGKTSIALEKLALCDEVKLVSIFHWEVFEPDSLKISPTNKIPAIEHRGWSV